MLSKLAFRNAKRSLKDYLIYLITITMSFSLMFAFNLVSNSEAVIKLSTGMDTFKNILLFVSAIIIFVVCFLINYTTKFMFEKRSKEFGTYMLLGIKKKEITKMFVLENILLGCLALALSIPIGFVFSQFISLIIVRILNVPGVVFISFGWKATGLLAIYFLAIYILVLLNMWRKMRKMSVHGFLYLEKQNEKKMFQNKKNRNRIFVISVLIGIISVFIWHSQFNMKNFSNQETINYLFVCTIGFIISIYGISATVSDMILSVVLRSKGMKYSNDNLFVTRTFASKARTMSFVLGTFSVLILVALLCFNMSGITKGMYDSILNQDAPYDVAVMDDRNFHDEYLAVIDEDYTIEDSFAYDIYWDKKCQVQKYVGQFHDSDCIVKLSDYNRLMELRDEDTVELKDNEYMIVAAASTEARLKDIQEIKKVQMSGGKTLKLKEITTDNFWVFMNGEADYTMIFPDEYVRNLEAGESHLVVNTKEGTNAKLEDKIQEKMKRHLGDKTYKVTSRGEVIEEQNTMTAMLSSICLYMAFIFIAVVGTILAVQSLSDSTKYKYRYLTLRRLGVNDKNLYKTIRKQLLVLFGLPLIYPVVLCFFLVKSINNIYYIFLESQSTYILYYFSGLLVFLCIYAVYWIVTYIGFKRNINE
ncbi:hypothetical protein HMPREF9477_00004 [Lachnospiraceae bacterium 2_1_46FAA]|nr:hypothetical protein HMPREF9477_00004 [Lachnospiraceae bacterium 2_1_46FAA]